MLTFETAAIQGVTGIIEKLVVCILSHRNTHILTDSYELQSLPFDKIKHQISTLDAQPSNEAGGILVMVTGALLVRH